ncbi:MAG: hypothetical protein VKS61_07700 [Candidatus Sericytochromatia bacterium]|nr:hypothetical protein [Candidatus Sericytochromatia bacterium]
MKGDKGAPAELVAGGTVAFTLKVQNTGNVPLSNLAVRVRPEDDGIGLAQDCVGCLTELGLDRPLPPGELVSLGRVGLRADPDLAAGLRFSVVAEGTASGGVRTAERFEFELGALPPELTWTAVESATDVRSLREGSSSFKAIRVRLANAGQSDARNVLAELESDDPGIRVGAFCKPCVADQRVARIDAGGTHLLDQPFGLTAKDGRKGRRNVPLRLILRDGDGRKWRLERETPLTF